MIWWNSMWPRTQNWCSGGEENSQTVKLFFHIISHKRTCVKDFVIIQNSFLFLLQNRISGWEALDKLDVYLSFYLSKGMYIAISHLTRGYHRLRAWFSDGFSISQDRKGMNETKYICVTFFLCIVVLFYCFYFLLNYLWNLFSNSGNILKCKVNISVSLETLHLRRHKNSPVKPTQIKFNSSLSAWLLRSKRVLD